MPQSIWNNERIGDPVYVGLTMGGLFTGATLVKASFPGLRAIRLKTGEFLMAVDLPASYTVPGGGGTANNAVELWL